MSEIRAQVAKATAGAALFAGPVMAGAEASGALHETTRPFMVYLLSAAITIVGAMFTALMWFIKREHESITGGIKSVKVALDNHATQVQALMISTERGFAQLQGEVSKRLLITEHGRSSGALHEKVNRLGRTLAFLSGKLGLPPEDVSAVMPPTPLEGDEPHE